MIGKGQFFSKTHDLFLLLEKILPLNREAEQLRDVRAVLLPYAVEIRYPDEGFMPSEADAKEARDAAGHVMQWFVKASPEIIEHADYGSSVSFRLV